MQWNEYEGLNGSSRCQLGYLERIKLYFRLEKKIVILGAKCGAKDLTGEIKVYI